MQNIKIKKAAKDANVKLWQIAEKLGISDAAFSRKMRYLLEESEKCKILKIIEQLKQK